MTKHTILGALALCSLSVVGAQTAHAASPLTCHGQRGFCTKSTHPSPQTVWLVALANNLHLSTCLSPIDTDGYYGVSVDARVQYALSHHQALPVNDAQTDYNDSLCAQVSVPVPSRAALAGPRLRAFYGRVRAQIADEGAIVGDVQQIRTLTGCRADDPQCMHPHLAPAQDATWLALVADLSTRALRVRAQALGIRTTWRALNNANQIVLSAGTSGSR